VKPGVYDLPAEAYHADPVPGGSLTSTGARKLLPPSCPALFEFDRRHPRATTKAFDYGHAAHKMVLGAGPKLVTVHANDWRTKGAQQQRAEAHALGQVPLLRRDYEQVQAMAAALQKHPFAARLFAPGSGWPEQTLVWQDPDTGVWCRAMLDWLPHPVPGRRMVIPDYKSTDCAAPAAFRRSVANFGYHQQADWYRDGVAALGLDEKPAFVFVAQDKNPPYLVTVVELDAVALSIGRFLNARARQIYRDCTEAGVWPGYADDVETIALPRWAEHQFEETTSA
jgi:hypothetical protein